MSALQDLQARIYVHHFLIQTMVGLGLASLSPDKARAFREQVRHVFDVVTDPVRAKADGHGKFAAHVRKDFDIMMKGIVELELQFRTSGPTVSRQ